MYHLLCKSPARTRVAVVAAGAPAGKTGRCGGVLRALTTSRGPEKISSGDKEGGGGGAAGLAVKSMGIGAGAGSLGSLVGLGGGFVAIPFLTGWLGLTQHQAHGTSLGAVFATGAAGSTAYALAGHVDYQAAGAIAVAGMAAAHAGARCTTGVDGNSLKMALGVLMLAVAPLVPLRDKISHKDDVSVKERHEEQSEERFSEEATGVLDGGRLFQAEAGGEGTSPSVPGVSSERVTTMLAIGAGSGFLAGIFGVGGGVLTVPSVSLATDLGHKKVLGTSLASMVLPALIGATTHYRQGNLIPRIAFPLALGTGVGAFVGGKYAARHLDESSLKLAFSLLMVVLGTRTIAGARSAAAAAAALKAAKRA